MGAVSMSYKVVCIGSRHITNEVNERMLRTLAVFKHIASPNTTGLRVLATHYTSFEAHFKHEFLKQVVGTPVLTENSRLKNIGDFVKEIYKRPGKISKYKFKQLCMIANSIFNADLVIAVPRNGKGRGAFALRVASALFKNSLDLTSESTELKLQEIEKEVAQQNKRTRYTKEVRERSYKKRLDALKEAIKKDSLLRRGNKETIEKVLLQLEEDFISFGGKFKPTGISHFKVAGMGNCNFKVMWRFKKNLYTEYNSPRRQEVPKKPNYSDALRDAQDSLRDALNAINTQQVRLEEPPPPQPPPMFQWGPQSDSPVEARVDYQQPWREVPLEAGRVEGNTIHIGQNPPDENNQYIRVPFPQGMFDGTNTYVRTANTVGNYTVSVDATPAETITILHRRLDDIYQRPWAHEPGIQNVNQNGDMFIAEFQARPPEREPEWLEEDDDYENEDNVIIDPGNEENQ